ncbi:MAG: hypothetical protein MI867_12905, partial [Pseudomonadales bacterium]|nr:hypothetical protein [Pseudomonadales bacterium]
MWSNVTADDYLLLLVSQRNAEVVSEAANQFAKQHPEVRVQARTDTQLLELSAQELADLFGRSHTVFGSGLYGPVVTLIEPYLNPI